jgi:hypothetical protein
MEAAAYESILYAVETMTAAGYLPDLIICSPADALDVRLLQLGSGVSYVFPQQLPSMVVSPSMSDGQGLVADASALGTLHMAPFTIAAFEEEAGSITTSTVRAEANGIFTVERETAAAYSALES